MPPPWKQPRVNDEDHDLVLHGYVVMRRDGAQSMPVSTARVSLHEGSRVMAIAVTAADGSFSMGFSIVPTPGQHGGVMQPQLTIQIVHDGTCSRVNVTRPAGIILEQGGRTMPSHDHGWPTGLMWLRQLYTVNTSEIVSVCVVERDNALEGIARTSTTLDGLWDDPGARLSFMVALYAILFMCTVILWTFQLGWNKRKAPALMRRHGVPHTMRTRNRQEHSSLHDRQPVSSHGDGASGNKPVTAVRPRCVRLPTHGDCFRVAAVLHSRSERENVTVLVDDDT